MAGGPAASLRQAGHAVKMCSTLAVAWASLCVEPPDAVLLGLGLPDGDGPSPLARLRTMLRRAAGRSKPVTEHGTLLQARSQVRSKSRLESALHGFAEALESNASEVQVHHLRRKLGESRIKTVRGVGHFIPRDDKPPPASAWLHRRPPRRGRSASSGAPGHWTLEALPVVWLTLVAVAGYTGHHEAEGITDGPLAAARPWLAVEPGAVTAPEPLYRQRVGACVQNRAVLMDLARTDFVR